MAQTLTIEQAEQKMFDMLKAEQMGDRIYEFAQELYQRYINVIETGTEIEGKDEYLDSDEEWYDEIHDEFFQTVYDRIRKFMKEGE